MHVFEVADHHAAGMQRLVDRTGSPGLVEQLRLPSGLDVASEADDVVRPGDMVVALVANAMGAQGIDALGDVARSLADGGTLLLLLDHPLTELPVGPLVQLLGDAGLQVVEAVPVSHPSLTAAVVAVRSSDKLAPFVPYLGTRPLPDPDDAQVRRLVNEHLVESVVTRARDALWAAAAEKGRTADAAAAELGDELRRERMRADALDASRTMAVGRAVAELRHHPFKGLAHLPKALRRRPGPTVEPR